MTRRPRRLSLLTVGATAILVFAACGGGGTATPTAPPVSTPATTPVAATPVSATPTAPSLATPAETPSTTPVASETTTPVASESPAAESQSPAPSETTGPVETPAGTPYPEPLAQPPAPAEGVMQYPDQAYGTVTCATDTAAGTFNGLPYDGNLKLIKAVDAKTVEFDFCNPNGEFLQQIAFAALAIDDAAYLIAHMGTAPGTGDIVTAPNGTGPYMLKSWDHGTRMDFETNPTYWGDKPKTPNLEFQWSDQAAARLVALNAGSVDGIDNPDKGDIAGIQANTDLKFFPREGLNTLYLGMNNSDAPWGNQDVRQAIAKAIDRKTLVDNFYPPGSQVADYFTPCAIPDACKGEKYWDYDPTGAKTQFEKGMNAQGLDPATFTTKLSFRAAVRGYDPDPPTVAQEIANELQTNLGITITLDLQESGTFLDNNAAGTLDGLFLLGWGADYPDASNFLDYHFGPGAGKKFGKPFPDLVKAVQKGDQGSTDAVRTDAYTKANDLIKKYVPAVVIAHGASGAAFKTDVQGAYAAPLLEDFKVMQAATRDTLVYMQNAEPLSLYCADETDGETLRACQQIKESLYTYGGKSGLDPIPALATKCEPNKDATVWTCMLRDNVKFQQGQDFGADDVILSFAAQWDQLNPLHQGRTGAFEYWNSLIGQGKLNPAGPCGLANTAACSTP